MLAVSHAALCCAGLSYPVPFISSYNSHVLCCIICRVRVVLQRVDSLFNFSVLSLFCASFSASLVTIHLYISMSATFLPFFLPSFLPALLCCFLALTSTLSLSPSLSLSLSPSLSACFVARPYTCQPVYLFCVSLSSLPLMVSTRPPILSWARSLSPVRPCLCMTTFSSSHFRGPKNAF